MTGNALIIRDSRQHGSALVLGVALGAVCSVLPVIRDQLSIILIMMVNRTVVAFEAGVIGDCLIYPPVPVMAFLRPLISRAGVATGAIVVPHGVSRRYPSGAENTGVPEGPHRSAPQEGEHDARDDGRSTPYEQRIAPKDVSRINALRQPFGRSTSRHESNPVIRIPDPKNLRPITQSTRSSRSSAGPYATKSPLEIAMDQPPIILAP